MTATAIRYSPNGEIVFTVNSDTIEEVAQMVETWDDEDEKYGLVDFEGDTGYYDWYVSGDEIWLRYWSNE